MTKRALVIIDIINDYLDHWSADKAARLIGETNKLAVAFREAGLPVIWVRPEFRPDLSDAFLEMRDKNLKIAIEGTSGAQFHAGLDWEPSDTTIVKKRYSAFYRTELEGILSAMGVGELDCAASTRTLVFVWPLSTLTNATFAWSWRRNASIPMMASMEGSRLTT